VTTPSEHDGLVIRAAVLSDVPEVLAVWDHARSPAAVTPWPFSPTFVGRASRHV
jgi:hypothetical protein